MSVRVGPGVPLSDHPEVCLARQEELHGEVGPGLPMGPGKNFLVLSSKNIDSLFCNE